MKKSSMICMVAILLLSVILAGCGGGTKASDPSPSPVNKDEIKKNTDLTGDVHIWTWNPAPLEQAIEGFNKYYPNVKITIDKVDDVIGKAATAIAAGTGAPDIFQIDGGNAKKFNTIEGLEDLTKAPYNAMRFKDQVPISQWEKWLSVDGKRLISFPWDAPPYLTWYRADIMEENGFPSDPVELGSYIQDKNNWLSIAQTLKVKDQYITQGPWEMIDMYTQNYGFFDHKLNYIRTGDAMVQALDMAKQVKQLGLGANLSIWNKEGQQAMDSGKIAMTYSGSWFGFCCMDPNLPNSKGKWRVTIPPFGLYRGSGGSSLGIPSQSKNKEAAWAFIEYALATKEGNKTEIATNNMPSYKPAWTLPEFENNKYEFLGGQLLMKFAAPLTEKIPPTITTPLDDAANKVFWDAINEAIEKNTDSATVIKKIQADVEAAVSVERQKLLDTMK